MTIYAADGTTVLGTKTLDATDLSNGYVVFTNKALPADGVMMTVKAKLTDSSGANEDPGWVAGTPGRDDARVDKTAPSGPATADLSSTSDTGVLGDHITSNTKPTISGTGTAGDTIKVTSPTGEVKTVIVASDGTWSVTLATPLPTGLNNISVTELDKAGNAGSPVTVPITIDTTAPAAATGGLKHDATNDTGTSTTDNITNKNKPTLSGATEANATVAVTINGKTYTTTADASGNWSVPVTDALPNNSYTPVIKVTDAAGNSTTSNGTAFTVDTTAPATPAAPVLAPASDSGTLNDNITNDTTPSIKIAAPGEGETPSLYVDGVKVAATYDAATGTLTPTNPLPVGAHTFTTTLTDAAGNESAKSPATTVTIDTSTAMTIGSVTDVNEDGKPTATGTAEPGATVTVTWPNGEKTQALAGADGSWTSTPLTIQPPTGTVSASSKDPAGNTSTTTTASYSDLIPPISTPVTLTVAEDGSVLVPLFGNDPYGGTVTAIKVTSLPPASQGVLVYDHDGDSGTAPIAVATNAELTPAQATTIQFIPAANYNGTVTPFTFVSKDQAGNLSDPASINITVTPVNDPPVANNKTKVTSEDTPVSGNVITDAVANTDIDSPSISLTGFSVGGASYAPGATATITGVGSITIAINGSYTFTPAPDYTGAVPVISYTISDGSLSSSATLALSITPTNDAPVANAVNGSGTQSGGDIAIALSATDTDSQIASYTIQTVPNASTQGSFYAGSTLITAGMTITPAQAATLVFRPVAGFFTAGPLNFSYIATDNNASPLASAPANITIVIDPVNHAPTVTGPLTGSGTEDTTVTVNLTANASDSVNETPAASLTYKLASAIPVGQGTLYKSDGTTVVTTSTVLTAAEASALKFVPATSYNGTVTFNFLVSDNGLVADGSTKQVLSTPSSMTITLSAVNDAPLLTVVNQNVTEDVASKLTGISVTDVDAGSGVMTMTISTTVGTLTAAGGGGVSVISGSGTTSLVLSGSQASLNAYLSSGSGVLYTSTSNAGNLGNASIPITVQVSDGGNTGSGGTLSNTATFNATVTQIADKDSITLDAATDYSNTAGNGLTYTVQGADLALNVVAPTSSSSGFLGLDRIYVTPGAIDTAIPAATAPTIVTDPTIAPFTNYRASKTDGFIYLKAGTTYNFDATNVDETMVLRIGGKTVYTNEEWGGPTVKTSFTPTVSGYYSFDMYFFNYSGGGGLPNLTINGVAINNTNFRLFSSASVLESRLIAAGAGGISDLQGTTDGMNGYYTALDNNQGSAGDTIVLSGITVSPVDTDGSETNVLTIGNIPVGMTLKDNAGHTFLSVAGSTTATITDWNLANLSLVTPRSTAAGNIGLLVTSTSTEINNPASTAADTKTITVNVGLNCKTYAGTAGSDTGANMIEGGNGHNRMFGGAGGDDMFGGTGNDMMYGGSAGFLRNSGFEYWSMLSAAERTKGDSFIYAQVNASTLAANGDSALGGWVTGTTPRANSATARTVELLAPSIGGAGSIAGVGAWIIDGTSDTPTATNSQDFDVKQNVVTMAGEQYYLNVALGNSTNGSVVDIYWGGTVIARFNTSGSVTTYQGVAPPVQTAVSGGHSPTTNLR